MAIIGNIPYFQTNPNHSHWADKAKRLLRPELANAVVRNDGVTSGKIQPALFATAKDFLGWIVSRCGRKELKLIGCIICHHGSRAVGILETQSSLLPLLFFWPRLSGRILRIEFAMVNGSYRVYWKDSNSNGRISSIMPMQQQWGPWGCPGP
jgi:hypothetical protein